MEWQEKVEMIDLHNQNDPKFYDYVLSKIENFDIQAWQMLANCINVFELDSSFVEKVKPFYEKIDTNNLDFRSAVRLETAFGDNEDVAED